MTSSQPKVVFLDRMAIRSPLRPLHFAHEWVEHATSAPDEIVTRLQGATIAITNRVRIGREVVRQLPCLKLIAVSATGYECIDIEACREAGIVVTNLRDWSTFAVAEHAFAMMLSLRRQLFLYRDAVLAGEWQNSTNYGLLKAPLPEDLFGSTLGIIGFGFLGQRLAELGSAFGMTVLVADHKGVDPREDRTGFEEVLRQADVVCIACPLTAATRGLIGAQELALVKPTVTLINCARGGIVDEAALAVALLEHRVGSAGVDVLSVEPPRDGNPLLDLSLNNLIVTPHMAFASEHALKSLAEQLMSTIESFVQGDPRNVVS